MMRQESIDYILCLLLGLPSIPNNTICYARAFDSESAITIKQSTFFDDGIFGTEKSLPSFPLSQLEGIPVLFGEPEIQRHGDRLYIMADLVASTFFLISRYEEIIRTGIRDEFGRFIGKQSTPYVSNFIDRPIVDEYTALIRRLLGLPLAMNKPRICLTHDIDLPYTHFNFFTAGKRVASNFVRHKRIDFYPVLNMIQHTEKDPLCKEFDALIDFDKRVKTCNVIYFAKAGGNEKPYDSNVYVQDVAFKKLSRRLIETGAEIGYHSSFAAGRNPTLIRTELETLENVLDRRITKHRSHYLCSREPLDFVELLKAGITDDYTMGYADVAGFRLGTGRVVRWINPYNADLTRLWLHPLIAMDVTLISKNYMALSDDDAIIYVKNLLKNLLSGSPSLLWHNHIVYGSKDQKNIYSALVNYLATSYIC